MTTPWQPIWESRMEGRRERAKRTNEPIATTQDKKIVGAENEMKGALSSRAGETL